MPDAADTMTPLIVRAHANYLEMFRALARASPDGAIEEDAGLLLVRCGPLLPTDNPAIVLRIPADPAAVLERARAFFARTGQGWALISFGAVSDAMGAAAAAAGLAAHPSPGLVLAPLAGEPPSVPGLVVRAVRDVPTLRVFNDTMTAGFGGPWALPEILQDRALLDIPGMTHYLGLVDGVPVATAMRFSSHGVAGVYNVSTVPAYRGRGIGAAITWRAALDGRVEGCIAAALQASEMGLPVYRRMGFRPVMTYHVWLPRQDGAP